MAKKIYVTNTGIGCFTLPILEFYERNEMLKKTNPQLNDEERAAVAYFGMLAEQPEPTTINKAWYIEPNNAKIRKNPFVTVKDETAQNIENWLNIENDAKYEFEGFLRLGATEATAQTAYYNNLKRLQDWIAYNGLWGGIQKTLMEQSRKLQGLRAGIEASKAAAAKALGLSQITDEMTDEARVEAAQAQAQAQKQYNEAIERENTLNKQLDNLSKGLPADFKSGDLAAGGVPVLPLVVGGLFLFWLGERKGRKAAR